MKKIIGKKYNFERVTFEVLAVDEYPAEKVSKRYKDVLKFRPGYLVAIDYRKTLIPNITVDDGVVRLTKVRIDSKVYSRPGAISSAIGITEAMHAYDIVEL